MRLNFVKSIEPMIKSLGSTAVEVGENMRYTTKDAKIAGDIFTRSSNSCTLVAVKSGNETLMGHFDPQYFSVSSFKENFMKLVKQLQDKHGEAEAIVAGGWERGRTLSQYKIQSDQVGAEVSAALLMSGMEPIYIFGKKPHIKTFDNMLVTNGEITLANEAFDPKKIDNKSIESIQKELKNIYEWVDIEPWQLR